MIEAEEEGREAAKSSHKSNQQLASTCTCDAYKRDDVAVAVVVVAAAGRVFVIVMSTVSSAL